jgi:O-acetylserine/cysteine efflux transporter
MNRYRLRSYLLLILVFVIWGIAGPVIKFTLGELSPIAFLTYRFFLSSLFLVPITFGLGYKFPTDTKSLLNLFWLSLLSSTVNLGLLFWGLNKTLVIDQTVISAVAPLLSVFAGAIFLNEHITKKEKTGTFITLIGVTFVILEPFLLKKVIAADGNLFGNLLIVASNLSWVAYVVLLKKALRKDVKPLVLTTAAFLVGFITLLPFAILETHGFANLVFQIKEVSLGTHLGVIYMALVSGALAYFLHSFAQKSIETSEMSVLSYLQYVISIPLAVFWLGEKLTTPLIIGSLIITLGIVISSLKKHALPKKGES